MRPFVSTTALLSLSIVLSLSSCTVTETRLGGAPAFVADGLALSSEPAPLRPDAAIMMDEKRMGAVSYHIITDADPSRGFTHSSNARVIAKSGRKNGARLRGSFTSPTRK